MRFSMYNRLYQVYKQMFKNKYYQQQKDDNEYSNLESFSLNQDNDREILLDSLKFACKTNKNRHQNGFKDNTMPFRFLSAEQSTKKFAQLARDVQSGLVQQYKTQALTNMLVYQLQTIKSDSKVTLYTYPKTASSFVLQYEYVKNLVLQEKQQLPKTQGISYLKQVEFWQLYQASNRLIDVKQYHLAQKCLQISEQHPQSFVKYNSLGFIHYNLEEYNNSQIIVKTVERAISLNNRNPYLINNLALLHLQNNRIQAKRLLQLSIDIKPNVPALNNLATVYFQEGIYGQAMKLFKMSFQIYESLNAIIGIASIYAISQQFYLSSQMFQMANNYQKNNKVILNNVGQSSLLRNDYVQAEGQFKKGIQLYPQYPYFYNSLGLIRCLHQQTQASLSLFKRAIQMQNLALFHSNYIICLIKAKRQDESLQYLRRILSQKKFKGEINLVEILHCLLYKYRYQRLIQIIDEFLPTQTKSLYKVLNYKAYILAYTRKEQSAVQCLQMALQQNEDPKILLNLASIHHFLSDNNKAKANIERAIELDPQQPIYNYFKGYLLLKEQKYQQSKKYLRLYLKVKPQSHQALNTLAVCAYYMKDYQSALQNIKNCLQIDPNYFPAINNHGIILLAKTGTPINMNLYFTSSNKNQFPAIFFNRANEMMKVRKYKQAIAFFNKAIQLNKNFTDAFLSLSEAYLKVNQPKQAVKSLKAAYVLRPQCYKCSLLFSRIASIYNSKKYCQKYINRTKLKADTLKITFNIALMSKILRNDQQFYEYLQFALQKLIVSAQQSEDSEIKQELKMLRQIYSYLMSIFSDCDAKDILLAIGLLQTHLNNIKEAQKLICAYISSFKLRKQTLSDSLISLVQRRFSKYSAENQYRFINCIIYHILRVQPQQGVLCCVKLRLKNNTVMFQSKVLELIEENKLRAFSQMKFFLNFYYKFARKCQTQAQRKQIRQSKYSNQNQSVARYICLMKYELEQQFKKIRQFSSKQQKSCLNEFQNQLKTMFLRNSLHITLRQSIKKWGFKQKQSFEPLSIPAIFKQKNFNKNQDVTQYLNQLYSVCCGNTLEIYMLGCYAYFQLHPYHQFYGFNKTEHFETCQQNNNQSHEFILNEAIYQYVSFQKQCQQQMSSFSQGQKEDIEKVQNEEYSDTSSVKLSENSIKSDKNEKPQVKKKNPVKKTKKALAATSCRKKQSKQTAKLQTKKQSNKRCKSLNILTKRLPQAQIKVNRYKKRRNLLNHIYLDGEENSKIPLVRSTSHKALPFKRYDSDYIKPDDPVSIQKADKLTEQQKQKVEQENLYQKYERKVIDLRYVNTSEHTLFFNKLIYFSQIALVEQLQKEKSQYLAPIKIISNNSRNMSKKVTSKNLNSCYEEYDYYVSKCDISEGNEDNCINHSLFDRFDLVQFLKQIGNIFIQFQLLGIHFTDIQLKNIRKSGKSFVFANFQSAFRILQRKQYHSYDLVKILVAQWISSKQNYIQDGFMKNHLFKGLSQQKIQQLFAWRSKKAKSQHTKTKFNQNLEFTMKYVEEAMRKDHVMNFIGLVEQVLNSNKIVSLQALKNIRQILRQSENIQQAIPFIVSSLNLLQNNQWEQQKLANYYLYQLQIEEIHKLQENLC